MATRRAKAHRDLVHYGKNAKRALRAPDLIGTLIYLGHASEAWYCYGQWKKKNQPRGTAEGIYKC